MGGTAAVAALELVHDTGLTGLIRSGSEHTLEEAGSVRLLPALPELRPLLPGGGLRRGSTVSVATVAGSVSGSVTEPAATVHRLGGPRTRPAASGARPAASRPEPAPAPAATSLLLALLAEPSRAGSWCAVVGIPTLGAAAAAELGIALDRLALVPHPGPDWPTVVAALLDGFDVVAVSAPGGGVAPAVASRLGARARQRGSVLMPYGAWAGADLTLEATDPQWHGIEAGRGRLRGRQLTVVARGRGAAALGRQTHLWLPRPTGLMVAEPDATARDAPTLVDGRPVDTGPVATIHPLRATGTG